MPKQFSAEIKAQAVKSVLAGESSAKAARDLGINSLYSWKSGYHKHPEQPFVGSGNQSI